MAPSFVMYGVRHESPRTTQGGTTPMKKFFLMLLALTFAALVLNVMIKKP